MSRINLLGIIRGIAWIIVCILIFGGLIWGVYWGWTAEDAPNLFTRMGYALVGGLAGFFIGTAIASFFSKILLYRLIKYLKNKYPHIREHLMLERYQSPVKKDAKRNEYF